MTEAGRLRAVVTGASRGVGRGVAEALAETGAVVFRAAYACSQLAAGLMVERRSGLIVNLSSWAARKYLANVAYGVAKAATDRLTTDAAHELRPFGVSVISLYPGLVRTERVMEAAEHFDLSGSESPRFTGRVVAALARDAKVARLSGTAQVVAALAPEYCVTDVDGSTPRAVIPH